MDPMSALAMIKAGLSAGKQIHSLGKEIAGFFDSVDDTNKKHQKKKNSKELERQGRIEREELQNKVITIAIVTCGLVLTAVTGGAYLWYIGMIKF